MYVLVSKRFHSTPFYFADYTCLYVPQLCEVDLTLRAHIPICCDVMSAVICLLLNALATPKVFKEEVQWVS